MPTHTTWRTVPDSNQEVLEMLATDTAAGTTHARDQLIQWAATVMHAGTQGGVSVEIPLEVQVSQEGELSLKMVLTYVAQCTHGLAARMARRRRSVIRAAAAV
jgi:hypothetical protein